MLPEWLVQLFMKVFGASFRNKILGFGAFGALTYQTAGLLLDGDVDTNPDWNAFAFEFSVAWALLFSRDNKVSTEEARFPK